MRVLHITHTHIHTGWGGRLEGDRDRDIEASYTDNWESTSSRHSNSKTLPAAFPSENLSHNHSLIPSTQ